MIGRVFPLSVKKDLIDSRALSKKINHSSIVSDSVDMKEDTGKHVG